MRKSRNVFFMACFTAITFIGCDSSKETKEKVMDIPVTTKSKEALEAFQKGLQLNDDGDFQQARNYFTKALQADSNLGIAYIFRSATGNTPKEFEDDLAKAKIHLDGASDWEKMYYDFNASFLTSDWNKRLEVVKKIADKYPDAARAQVDLGSTYLQSNDFAKAREAFQKAIQLNPNWVGGFSSLAASYLFNEPKDFKLAETNAMKAVELTPKASGTQILLGDCFRAENDMAKARDAYSKAISFDPNSPQGYYKKGHAESFMGSYDDARKDYMEGGKYDSVKFNFINPYANTYVYAGDTKAAQKFMMDELMKIDSSSVSSQRKTLDKLNAMNYCALISFHTGDAPGLKECVKMIEPVSMQLENEQTTNEAKLQQRANLYYWQALVPAVAGNYDEAKAKAEEIKTTLQPVNDPLKLQGYEFILGYISMKQKNYADAIAHFEKADPNSIYNQFMIAMANEAAGNKDKALAGYKKVAVYNFNGLDYALIRSEAIKKAAM